MVMLVRRTFDFAIRRITAVNGCSNTGGQSFKISTCRFLSTSTKENSQQQGGDNTPPYWDYSPSHGPSEWSKTWKTGDRQSPIDLSSKSSIYDSSLAPFVLDKKPVSFTATNIGNNVSISPDPGTEILLKGGPLQQLYRFAEMHLHWGELDVCGCEHTLDGERFAAELHLVHWNTGYETQPQAMDKSDGLAVLGIWLNAREANACHPGLDLILDMFGCVSEDGSRTQSGCEFSPYQLIPTRDANSSERFFTYSGSLTTPPLLESVVWTVFRDPVPISMAQWGRLNGVVTSRGPDGGDRFCKQCAVVKNAPSVISNNFREVQDLNRRFVQRSFEVDE